MTTAKTARPSGRDTPGRPAGPVEKCRMLAGALFALRWRPWLVALCVGRWLTGRYRGSGMGLIAALRLAATQTHMRRGQRPAPSLARLAARVRDPELAAIFQAHPHARGVVIYPPLVDWSWMKQRPHHLLTEFARAGYLVFFCPPQNRTDQLRGYRRIMDNLYLCEFIEPLRVVPEPIILLSHPRLLARLHGFHRPRIIYDYLDDLGVHDASGRPDPELVAAHQRLLADAAVVCATADRLLTEARAVRPDTLFCPNAVDYDHFHRAARPAPPDDLRPLVDAGRPLIGYYGALAQWFDMELLQAVAAQRPHYTFVLIGPDYDGALRDTLRALPPNVHWLGEKPYETLPDYLAHFTVATIPFRVNAITLATSPLKLYEYFAGGKPVVTTPLPECRKYAAVHVADGADAFAAALDTAVAVAADPEAVARLDELARANTWAARFAALHPRVFVPRVRSAEYVSARCAQARGVVVFPVSIGWGVDLFQRPHHLARWFARRGYVAVYDNSAWDDDFAGFKEVEPDVFLYRGTPDTLHALPNPLVWTFCYNLTLKDGYPRGTRVVYDLIDDFAVHPFDPALLQANHRRALREADVVAYVARQLEPFVAERPDALYLPNGVEDEFFADPHVTRPPDADFERVLAAGRPIAGYYGALAEWFDYPLLEQTARRRPDWSFVLIGPKYDASLEGQPLLKLPNVHWLGPRHYRALPAYLREFTVATIPFAINDITLATSPLKLYEYFAGGKPVITTPMPECMAFPEVQIVRTPDEFAAALDAARTRAADEEHVQRLRALARGNSWAARVAAVEAALDQRPAAP